MRNVSALLVGLLLVSCAAETADPVSGNCGPLQSSNRIALNRIALNRLAANRISLNRLAANRLAANRLAANRLAANKLAANKLAANRLAANRLAANGNACAAATVVELDAEAAGALVATADGRELLEYTVGCALPTGTVVVAEHAGTSYEFEGQIGLAPAWTDRALDLSEQRWVSACLMARTNAYGRSVEISLRGAHPALATDTEEADEWSLQEGAFWGNLFVPAEQPVDWNACTGLAGNTNETGDLDLRDCADLDPEHPELTLCGFHYAGTCSGAKQAGACASDGAEGSFYSSCSAGAGAYDAEPNDEVITTFVRP